jgi:hypothetical protein
MKPSGIEWSSDIPAKNVSILWAHFLQAKNRALRGFRHGKNKKHAVHVFYFCRDRFAPLQSLAHEPEAPLVKGSPWLRAPVELELRKAVAVGYKQHAQQWQIGRLRKSIF